MSTFKTTLEVPVVVHYEVRPFIKGSTDGPGGPPLEPDEPARMEIDYVEVDADWEPDARDLEDLTEEIGEYLDERENADRDDLDD